MAYFIFKLLLMAILLAGLVFGIVYYKSYKNKDHNDK